MRIPQTSVIQHQPHAERKEPVDLVALVTGGTMSSTPKTPQQHECEICARPSDHEGVCMSCTRFATVFGLRRSIQIRMAEDADRDSRQSSKPAQSRGPSMSPAKSTPAPTVRRPAVTTTTTHKPRARGTFDLSAKSLAQHRGGAVIALDSGAIGRAFQLVDAPWPTVLASVGGTGSVAMDVAVIPVFGPLAQRADTFCGYVDGYDSIGDRIVEALNEPSIGSIVLRLDSPGGDVSGLECAIDRIVEARKASGKVIAAYVDELAASAGYWLAACVCDGGIFAPVAGRVGSIGCYSILRDERGALQQEGIAIKLVRDPAGKDAANPLEPVTDVALARAQAEVSAISARFYAAVAAARGLKPEAVRAFNGAVFAAEQALSNGLIDGIATLDEVIVRASTGRKSGRK